MLRTALLLVMSLSVMHVSGFCDFTPLNMGCESIPVMGFVDLNLMNNTQGNYEAVLALTVPPNKSAILILDTPRENINGTLAPTSEISTSNNSLVLSSPSTIRVDTLDNQGLLLEGRVRLWISGLDVNDDSKPNCLMMNNTILGCINAKSNWDTDIVFYWKYIAITLAITIFALFVGIFVGACAYRSRLTRIATDADIARINLDNSDEEGGRL